MPTRRSYLGLSVAFSVSLAGCTVNIGDTGGSGGNSETQQSEPEPESETEPESNLPESSVEEEENEPSGRLSVLSMVPLDGWQVTANVEMGDADGIVISHENEVLDRVETSGRHRVAGGDDEDDKLMHYEDVEDGDRFRLVAGYDDDSKDPITLAEEYAI